MEHPRIDDQHVVDRYLRGELPDDEVEAFEEHLFACGACLEAVEWGEELRLGVRTVAAEAALDADDHDDSEFDLPEEIRSVAKPWLASPAGQRLFAALAVALLAVGVVALRQNAELSRLRDTPDVTAGFTEPTADFQVASLGIVRDAGVTEIHLDPARSGVLLSLELSEATAAHYRVTLYDSSDRVVWQGEDLEPSLYDSLMIAVPASFLPPGDYRATFEGMPSSAGATVGRIEFRIVADR